MWCLGLILLCCSFHLISCGICLQEVLKCSPLREPMSIRHRLPETTQYLDLICRSQDRFMNCISEAAKFCYTGPSTLEMYVLSNRMFLLDLCAYRPGSTDRLRMQYLRNVHCINNQKLHDCVAAVIAAESNSRSMSTKCFVRNELETCGYKMILENCGSEAEALMRHITVLETDDFTCATEGNQTENAVTEREPEDDETEDDGTKLEPEDDKTEDDGTKLEPEDDKTEDDGTELEPEDDKTEDDGTEFEPEDDKTEDDGTEFEPEDNQTEDAVAELEPEVNQTEDAVTELEPSYLLIDRIGSRAEYESQSSESSDKELHFKNDLMDIKESSNSQTNFVREETGKLHSSLMPHISKETKTYCDYIRGEKAHCEPEEPSFREVFNTSPISRNAEEGNTMPRQKNTSDLSDVHSEELYGIETSLKNTQGDTNINRELNQYLKFLDCEESEYEACVANKELQHITLNKIKDFGGHVLSLGEESDNRAQTSSMYVPKILTERDLTADLRNLFLTRLANERSKHDTQNFEIPLLVIKRGKNKSTSEFRNFVKGNALVFWVDIDFNQVKYLCTLASFANQTTYILCVDALTESYNSDYYYLYLDGNQRVKSTTTVEPNTLHTEEKSRLNNEDSVHLEEYYNSKNENYEESINITEFLRKIGEHNHDTSKMEIKSRVHSASGEEPNAEPEITGTETPILTTVTTRAEELRTTPPHTLSEGNLEDSTENSDFIVFEDMSDLEVERYKDLEIPVLDLSHNFVIKSIPVIENIINPELNIRAFQYSDRSVNVYWEHPYTPPFKTLMCRKAGIIEQYYGKSFTCTITLD